MSEDVAKTRRGRGRDMAKEYAAVREMLSNQATKYEAQLAALREENARLRISEQAGLIREGALSQQVAALRQRVEELERDALSSAPPYYRKWEEAFKRAEAAEAEARLNRAAAEKHYAYGEAQKDRAESAEAEVERLRAALEIIAGKRQCLDNLMSNRDVARAALAPAQPEEGKP